MDCLRTCSATKSSPESGEQRPSQVKLERQKNVFNMMFYDNNEQSLHRHPQRQ